MEPEEKRFWVGITVFATLFGIGGYIVFEHAVWGWLFMIAGLGGLVLGIVEKIKRVHLSSASWLVAILMTWAGIGYDYYDRHADQAFVDDDDSHLTVVAGKTFRNETVLVDRKDFENCTFEHVTLKYNGTGRCKIAYCKFIGSLKMDSDNKIVLGALSIAMAFNRSASSYDKDGNAVPPGMIFKP